MLNLSFNISYEYGGRALLDKSWNKYGYCIGENKLFYILKGELVIRIDGVEYDCKEGDLVLIPSGIKHDFFLREGKSCEKFWFHFSTLQGNKQVTLLYDLPVRLACGDTAIKKLCGTIIKPVQNTVNALKRANNMLSVLSYYIEKSGAKEKTAISDDIDQTIEFIHENLSSPLTLSALASRIYLSTGYFTRKFHQKTGLSPMKFITLARVQETKRLLSETDLSINEIMTRVGIYDSAYFSKFFKSATGFSPRFFRKNMGFS